MNRQRRQIAIFQYQSIQMPHVQYTSVELIDGDKLHGRGIETIDDVFFGRYRLGHLPCANRDVFSADHVLDLAEEQEKHFTVVRPQQHQVPGPFEPHAKFALFHELGVNLVQIGHLVLDAVWVHGVPQAQIVTAVRLLTHQTRPERPSLPLLSAVQVLDLDRSLDYHLGAIAVERALTYRSTSILLVGNFKQNDITLTALLLRLHKRRNSNNDCGVIV